MATLREAALNVLERQGATDYEEQAGYSGRGMEGKVSSFAVAFHEPHGRGPQSVVGLALKGLGLSCDSLGRGWVYYSRKPVPEAQLPLPTVPEFSSAHFDLMAALVFLRFGRDHEAARAAWSRMHENHGWDTDAESRHEWKRQVERGLRALRSSGYVTTSSAYEEN